MRSNGLKSAVAAFSFFQIESHMLQISPCDSTFFLRLNTLSTAQLLNLGLTLKMIIHSK